MTPKITLYHMHGCGWCDKFMPEWQKLTSMSGITTNIVERSEMSTEDGKRIHSFPTIIITVNGLDTVYKGDRTAEMIHRRATSQQGGAIDYEYKARKYRHKYETLLKQLRSRENAPVVDAVNEDVVPEATVQNEPSNAGDAVPEILNFRLYKIRNLL